ncbi:glycoside hydrolase superfamily [Infundibulicybe gibba]|nr:glycoside hydrolase superfamily [Infundibulicybe gibba]
MKFLAALALALTTVYANPLEKRAQPQGIDVSGFQPSVNWAIVKANGLSFAYIKATEGTTFTSSSFSSQYTGATNAGFIRGAYHFAHPDSSSGAAQANFFLAHGGGWSGDGITLPGALDIEYNPSGAECYGLSASAMVAWIRDFSNTYHAATTRNSAAFAATSPLWIARYASAIGTLPAGWRYVTLVWLHDLFNGDAAGLKR